jgi:hypothetical protein
MTQDRKELEALAAEWRQARAIYSIYHGIALRFALEAPDCPLLESPVNAADREALATIDGWFCEMDGIIQVHQLRLFLQTSPLSCEASLRYLILHQFHKQTHAATDRDKLDFLMVQYFAQCAPESMMHTPPGFEDVSFVLRPVLGDVLSDDMATSMSQLGDVIRRMSGCGALMDLLQQHLLEEVRKIKASVQEEYFAAPTLIAFARLNFLTRQTFFRLMRADLEAIRSGVRTLQQRGVETIDCSRAQLSTEEPLARVLEMARQWKKPFLAEYSAGNHFVQLAELRAAVEEVLDRTAPDEPEPVEQAPAEPPPAAVADPVFSEFSSAENPVAADGSPATSPVSRPAAVADAAPDLTDDLRKVRKQLAHYLMADRARTRTVGATIVVGQARLTLSSWEVTAFVEGVGEFTETVQRGVATRVLLFQHMEQAKQNGARQKLTDVVAAAREEAARLQQSVTDAREARNIEATVTLSATAQRLIGIIAEAEGILQLG